MSGEHERIRLEGLSPISYQHPTDSAALASLSKVPGIDRVLRFAFRLVHERRARLEFLSCSVRVNERQFSRVNELFEEACHTLDIERRPELFIAQTPIPNAFAYGVDKPFVVVHSSLIDLLDDRELQAVLGHELGHISSNHMLYYSVLTALMNVMKMGGLGIPFGNLGLRAFLLALFEWYRKAELTCDRAALLVSQDPQVCHRAQMKLAGGPRIDQMDFDAFMEQAVEYEEQNDVLDCIYKVLNNWGMTHPHPVARIRELQNWVDSGAYQDILDGSFVTRDQPQHTKVAEQWKQVVQNTKSSAAKTSGDALTNLAEEARKLGEKLQQPKDETKDDGSEEKEESKNWFSQILAAAEDKLDQKRDEQGDPPEPADISFPPPPDPPDDEWDDGSSLGNDPKPDPPKPPPPSDDKPERRMGPQ